MGEVYRARDGRLGRQVALKILPEPFASDADRVARFAREAQVLAALSHPNIAQIYGVEELSGGTALVMELVEGPTLADVLGRTAPLPLDDALRFARQIAEALEAAHDKGIVHRDLKPANVKVTPDGKVKVLDFGLAKLVEGDTAPSNLTMSPTVSARATHAGVILGTAAYMSPEQARGKAVDRRTDIWAFGCVLFELLAGRRPFETGDTVSDAVAAILKTEPDWSALPAGIPAHIRTLLRRCLQKDAEKRLPHIGVARLEIDEGSSEAGTVPSAVPPLITSRPWRRRAMPVALAAVGAALLTGTAVAYLRTEPFAPVTRFTVPLRDGQASLGTTRTWVAVSPDGSRIVYVASPARLFLRPLASFEATAIAGTEGFEGVSNPVFSPDGESIAFWANSDRTLKRIAVSGGAAMTLCPAENPVGMSWGSTGIVFAQPTKGIMRISADGGTPEVLVALKEGEQIHRPEVLPDGEHVLFTLASGTIGLDRWDKAEIVVQALKTGVRKVLLSGSDARYLSTGHLMYAFGGSLFVVGFDVGRLEVSGGSRRAAVVEGVLRSTGSSTGAYHFDASAQGALVYIPGPVSAINQSDIALTDRKGVIVPLKLPPGPYDYPRLSPDDARIAYTTDDGKEAVVWVYDLSGTSAPRRLTFGGNNRFPVWSSDGTRVTYQSDREGDLGIWWQMAAGTGVAERLTKAEPGGWHIPESWSPTGTGKLLFSAGKATDVALSILSLEDRRVTAFGPVRSNFPFSAVFSPNGRWVAYAVSQNGVSLLYVEPFPQTGAKFQVAATGLASNAHHPVWSRNGEQLLFVGQPATLFEVSFASAPGVAFGTPTDVPRTFAFANPVTPRPFDIARDGKILGIITAGQTQVASLQRQQMNVVLNWFEEVKRRAPAR
jgi:serine/threonine-protein kinase